MNHNPSNEYTWTDKEGGTKQEVMPPGPWLDEPDKVVWRDEATDMDCMIVRGPSGALCGYVAVKPDHPDYGVDAGLVGVDAHGGLNYANTCGGVICHVPDDPESDDVWWLGFDCAHYSDYCPAFGRLGPAFTMKPNETYKNIDYVKQECENLARQLNERNTP